MWWLNRQEVLHFVPTVLRALARYANIPKIQARFVDGLWNARATRGSNLIEVDPEFLVAAGDPFRRGVASTRREHVGFIVAVLAHEVGHLLQPVSTASHSGEFDADAFAVNALVAFNIDPSPFELFLFGSRGSSSHPSGLARMRRAVNVRVDRRFFAGR